MRLPVTMFNETRACFRNLTSFSKADRVEAATGDVTAEDHEFLQIAPFLFQLNVICEHALNNDIPVEAILWGLSRQSDIIMSGYLSSSSRTIQKQADEIAELTEAAASGTTEDWLRQQFEGAEEERRNQFEDAQPGDTFVWRGVTYERTSHHTWKITPTGRRSRAEPNMQSIHPCTEEGNKIREAFTEKPENFDPAVDGDYIHLDEERVERGDGRGE